VGRETNRIEVTEIDYMTMMMMMMIMMMNPATRVKMFG